MAMGRDVIVIGGGITGAGVLRDCALRGLKALLIEKGRLGGATTAASTHLIHGGLRYLLYDRATTQTACWDSGNIVRIARPLLTRLPIVWPVYCGHRHGMAAVETLLEAYDALSPMKEGRPHLRLGAAQTLRLFPELEPTGLLGSLSFDEWWVDPTALVEANVASARNLGAEVRTGTRVTALLREGDRIAGVRAERPDGSSEEFRARVIVNAAGPWADRVASLAGLRVPLRLRKGTHLLYQAPVSCLPVGFPAGLLLEAEGHDRYVFVVFSGRDTLVGPTDLLGGDDPDRIAADAGEIRYLLASVRRYFPVFPERFDRALAGARPILDQSGSEKRLSRGYEVLDHEPRDGLAGLMTVAGGKMSDFRLMAQEAADLACRKLGKNEPCRTLEFTLDGRPVEGAPPLERPRAAPFAGFLRRHPLLRECHALSHLGVCFIRRLGRNALGGPDAALEEFDSRYFGHGPER